MNLNDGDHYGIVVKWSWAELLDENTTFESMFDKIQNAIDENDLNLKLSICEEYGGLSITAHEVGSSTVTVDADKLRKVSVTYKQIADGYTFNDFVSDINNCGLNVKATYDSVQDAFSLYNKESGASNQIGFNFGTDDAGLAALEFFDSMGLCQSENGQLTNPVEMGYEVNRLGATGTTSFVVAGKDAIVKIDGKDYITDSNKLNVNGVIYNFTGTNATVNGEGKVESVKGERKTTVNVF